MNKKTLYTTLLGITTLGIGLFLWSYEKHDHEKMLVLKKRRRYAILIAIIAIFAGLFAWYKFTPGPYDKLTTCLKDQGVLFYGTFWCPHCQNQKLMFGKSASTLPYVECSTSDGKGQLPVCTNAGITGYPTWVFLDGTRLSGEQEPSVLAEKTFCHLE